MSASPKNTDERQNAHGGAGQGWARTGGGVARGGRTGGWVDERGTHLGGGGERQEARWKFSHKRHKNTKGEQCL